MQIEIRQAFLSQTRTFRSYGLERISWLAVLLLAVCLTAPLHAQGKGNGGGGGGNGGGKGGGGDDEPPPPGVVYFANHEPTSEILVANAADGSGETLLFSQGGPVTPYNGLEEPTQMLHGGLRWFLEGQPIPGGTYPDGRQRFEIFAVDSSR